MVQKQAQRRKSSKKVKNYFVYYIIKCTISFQPLRTSFKVARVELVFKWQYLATCYKGLKWTSAVSRRVGNVFVKMARTGND